MTRFPLRSPWLIGLLALAMPALAADTRIIAFGDSVTAGYGDDESNPNPGYPSRLEGNLRSAGFAVEVVNEGVAGETTAEGLARVNDVLDQGGEAFLLMEGTNDLYRGLSIETVQFNLNALARKAEARGMTAVHATVIPHRPDGVGDNDNDATRELQLAVLDLAAQQGRAVVDAFATFWDEPDWASRFYLVAPPEEDPVGHPNADGYDLLADAFTDVARTLLEGSTGSGQIVVLTQPIVAGEAAAFGVDLQGTYSSVLWRFGSEGWAVGQIATGYGASFVFGEAGTYPVTVQAVAPSGRIVSSFVEVSVSGPSPSWDTARSLIPLARRSQLSATGTRRHTELRLTNAGPFAARVEVELLAPSLTPRAAVLRSTVGPIAFGLRAGETALLADVLPLLGVPEGTASLRITSRVPTGRFGPKVHASARVVTQSASGVSEETLDEVPEAAWSGGTRSIGGLSAEYGGSGAMVVSNPGGALTNVTLDLLDSDGVSIHSAVVAVEAGATVVKALPVLFPTLLTDPGPFALHLSPGTAGVVAALESALSGGDDRSLIALPVETSAPSRLFLPTLGSGGDGMERQLLLHNPGAGSAQLHFALLRPESSNSSPPTADRTLAAGESMVIDDPRSTLFGQSSGEGLLRVDWTAAGTPPIAVGTTRTSLGGTLGTALHASGLDGLVGEAALLELPPPGSGGSSRLGLAELTAHAVEVRVRLLDELGEPIASKTLFLESREVREVGLAGLFPGLEGEVGWSLALTAPEGSSVLGYLVSTGPNGDLSIARARSTAGL